MNLATMFIELRAKDDKLKSDLSSAESEVRKKADSLSKQVAQIFGAAAFGAGIKKSIDAASDLNETISKTKQLFDTDADAVIAFSKTTAQSMGLSQRAYLDAASGLKGLLDNLGLASQDATAWSQKLTQLGSDLGSFFNKDPAEAIAAIGSALRGESEPIRAFNVQINEAAVKTKALEMGLYDGKGAIDSNAKAQATLALIMQQTSDAQGDFAKTADGAANSQRVAKAVAEESAASLGQALLPVYTKVVQVVTLLAKGFGGLSSPIQLALVALVGFVALGGPISKVVDIGKALTDTFKYLGTSGKIAFGALGVAGGLALFALNQHLSNVEKTKAFDKARIDLFVQALKDGATAAQAWDQAIGEGGKLEFVDAGSFTSEVKDVTGSLARMGITFDELKAHLGGSREEFALWAGSLSTFGKEGSAEKASDLNHVIQAGTQLMGEYATATQQAADQAKIHATSLDGERHGLDQAKGSADGAKSAQDELAAATTEAARKSDEFASSLQRQLDKLAELYPKAYDAVKAKYDYADSQVAAMVATDNMNKTLADHKSTQDDVTTATNNARDAIISQSEKYATLDGAALGSEGAIRRQIQSLEATRDTLAPGSPLRAFLDQYISDLNNIPANISSILQLHIASDATNPGAPGYIPRNAPGGRGATGQPTRRGALVEVTEQNRPEVYEQNGRMYLLPTAAGQVMPWGNGAPSGGGLPPIVVHNNGREFTVDDMSRAIQLARLS